ncbi:hypothetical protein C0J52_22641 [Blattella germanica]|nr:hypothetical protein C0J52_22641 [Blattella germanica]
MYVYNCILYVKKNMNKFLSHHDVHNYNNRNCSDIVPEFCRFSTTQKYVGKFFTTDYPNLLETWSIRSSSCLYSVQDYFRFN